MTDPPATGAVVRTERLSMRQMNPGDVDALLAVLGDSEAMRFYPTPFTLEQVRGWIEWNLRNYEDHGYGLWALVLEESGDVIGDCGLTWQRVGSLPSRELEMGWHIRRDHWNRGIATEAARGVLAYARDVIGAERLIALIDPDNLPSQAVARKVGMTLERWDRIDSRRRMVLSTQPGGAIEQGAGQPVARDDGHDHPPA